MPYLQKHHKAKSISITFRHHEKAFEATPRQMLITEMVNAVGEADERPAAPRSATARTARPLVDPPGCRRADRATRLPGSTLGVQPATTS
ncbi:hypothetical protein ABZ912_29580 [Nonomuraea angiospora]|uniref:hypothetical protein n=1 Tax=Nonomuraea angiospora TaxID=46172 RepID=UPI003400AE6A